MGSGYSVGLLAGRIAATSSIRCGSESGRSRAPTARSGRQSRSSRRTPSPDRKHGRPAHDSANGSLVRGLPHLRAGFSRAAATNSEWKFFVPRRHGPDALAALPPVGLADAAGDGGSYDHGRRPLALPGVRRAIRSPPLHLARSRRHRTPRLRQVEQALDRFDHVRTGGDLLSRPARVRDSFPRLTVSDSSPPAHPTANSAINSSRFHLLAVRGE